MRLILTFPITGSVATNAWLVTLLSGVPLLTHQSCRVSYIKMWFKTSDQEKSLLMNTVVLVVVPMLLTSTLQS